MRIRLATLALLALLVSAAPATAAFPGTNGKIVLSDVPGSGFNDVFSVNPDGTGRVNLTNMADEDRTPAWSPDGTRIAFASRRDGNFEIYVMNADGTGQTRVTNNPATDIDPSWDPSGDFLAFTSTRDGNSEVYTTSLDGSVQTRITNHTASDGEPAWSPDGRRIALVSDRVRGIDYDIFTVKPDGTDLQQVPLPPAPNECWFVGPDYSHPDWSPSGERIVFATFGDEECIVEEQVGRIEAVRPDGSGRQAIVDDIFIVTEPAWSPDGTRVAYVYPDSNQIRTVSASGGASQTVTNGEAPDWQPIQSNVSATHVRPIGATPFRVPLVPAAKQCTSPNRTHGPALAFPSCNPPQPGSPNLTVGVGDGSPAFAKSEGFLRMDVIVGTPGPPDTSDVSIRLRLTNVMNLSGLSDYTGELRARLVQRITSRNSGGLSATTVDLPFDFNVPCAATADTTLGGLCSVQTTMDAIEPGLAPETARTLYALGALNVYDGGPDGDAETQGDNSLLATQGVFVP